MRRRSVCGFADADKSTREEQQGKGRRETASDRCDASEEHARGNNFWLIETVGVISGRDAGQSENHQQHHLQGAELRVGEPKVRPQKRHKRIQDLTISKIDEVD